MDEFVDGGAGGGLSQKDSAWAQSARANVECANASRSDVGQVLDQSGVFALANAPAIAGGQLDPAIPCVDFDRLLERAQEGFDGCNRRVQHRFEVPDVNIPAGLDV